MIATVIKGVVEASMMVNKDLQHNGDSFMVNEFHNSLEQTQDRDVDTC